jgi:hypothetical protein
MMHLLLPILVALVGGIFAGVVLYFWPAIMGWARDHLLPWIDDHLPGLADDVRLAFAKADEVAVQARKAIRAAWQRLRTVLLSETAEFLQIFGSSNEWKVQITSYLQRMQDSGKPVVRVVTEEHLNWDDLPAEIRQQAMAKGVRQSSLDITTARDEYLDKLVTES